MRFRGGNIHPLAAQTANPSEPWAELQRGWTSSGYWTSVVKFQIDLAVSAGLNAVRLIFDVGGANVGSYTQAAQQANLAQMLAYCRSVGVHAYPCLGDPAHLQGATYSYVQSDLVALAQVCNSYTDVVVGIDLLNESPGRWPGLTNVQIFANIGTLYTAVRAVLDNNIPISASAVSQNGDFSNSGLWGAWPVLDFYDFHSYYIAGAADVSPRSYGKPFCLGEYGDPTEPDTPANIVPYINANVANVVNQLNAYGGFYWVISFTGVGMYDASGTPYPTVVAAVQATRTTYP